MRVLCYAECSFKLVSLQNYVLKKFFKIFIFDRNKNLKIYNRQDHKMSMLRVFFKYLSSSFIPTVLINH